MQTLPYQELERVASRGLGDQPDSSGRPGRGVGRPGALATFLCVAGATVFTLIQIRPGLILKQSTDVGGDNAAHIVAAFYLIHHLLPRGQISGWDPQWWGGFPLYVFYFPLPALLIAAFNSVFSYAVAFKIVTVIGTIFLPLAGYAFGRLAGFARPVPALMSIATVAFIFNTSYTIDGGNLASTLAGEFSFTLSVTFALLFLGVFAHCLRTGRLRWLAAVLFALTVLSHVVPALFAAAGAVALTVAARDRRYGLRVLATVGVVGGLVTAFWLLRFGADLRYSSSMAYTKVGDPLGNLLPFSAELAVQVLAALSIPLAIWRRQRVALVLAVLALGAAIAFWVFPSGTVYNGRWLPFWFLCTTLLAAYALGELGRLALSFCFAGRANEWATPVVVGLMAIGVVAGYLGVLPGYTTPSASRSFLPDWVSWNYTGYEAKSGWPEYQQLLAMMMSAAKVHGCGRLDYEYSANMNDVFGSTLVPMAFPYWTGGCIDSEEGLYYESSSATPFHFLDQSELSLSASNPVVGIPYQGLNVADGIRHLQLTGTKYFLANSPEVESQAAADPELVQVGAIPASANVIETSTTPGALSSSPRWVLYELKDSPIVTPLSYQPIVESGTNKATWQKDAIAWYQDPSDWSVPIVTTGPLNWLRERPGVLLGTDSAIPVKATKVSRVQTTDSSISFNVSTLGVPIDVKIPYFPNWQASGATGPYLESPNLMVVVPTSHHVVLSYGTTTVDWLGRAGTAVGLGGLMLLRTPLNPPLTENEQSPLTPSEPLPPESPEGSAPDLGLTPLEPPKQRPGENGDEPWPAS